MSKKNKVLNNGRHAFNSLQKAIVFAFPALYLGGALPALGQTLTAGQDIYTNGLNAGYYDLVLDGNVSWNTAFSMNSAAKSTISIDGNGYTITTSSNNSQRLFNITQATNTISITNATITSQPFTGAQSTLIKIGESNDVVNLNLEGTTFLNIGPSDYNTYTSADYGPILSIRGGSNATMNIDGGTQGVLFKGNHGLADQPGAVGLYYNNTMNFKGKVTFEGNWTGNYGGAVTVFDTNGSTMTFADETNFINNHSSVFGGAVDLWGGAATLTFNGATTFSDNYVYGVTTFSPDYPNHVTGQHSRGGAINIGYVNPGTAGVNLIFNNDVNFTGNYVIESKNNYNALGGAVSAYGNGSNYNYLMTFNGATKFDGNYAYSLTGAGYGGAIYYDAGSAATVTIGGGSSLTNNYAKTLGGAIYLRTGTINLNADDGDIIFQGNRQGADFAAVEGGLYAPVADSGNPNAIYLGGSGSLNMAVDSGNFIHFYDPIASISTATITVNKTGAGEVLFHGNSNNYGDPLYNSDVQTNTNVNGGTFSFTDGVSYGNSGFGVFAVNNGGIVRGNNNSTLQAQTININSGGTLAANGGIFNLNVGSGGVTSTAGRFGGYGTIVAPSISLSANVANISTADIDANNELTLDSLLTNAGGLSKIGDGVLVLTKTNTYTGATSISAGTLRADTTNIIAASAGLNISGGTFDLNNYDQTLKSLSGTGGAITTGTGLLTVNSGADTTYAGTIRGDGSFYKQGSGALTLTGDVALLDSASLLQISGGSLTVNGGNTVQVTQSIIDNGTALTVSNAGTKFITDSLSVGNATSSTNTLTVNNGGQVTVAEILSLGSSSNSVGNIVVDGVGSLIDANEVQVGYSAGSGSIALNNSGTLLTNQLQRGTGTNGSVNLGGGVLKAKSDNNSFITGFSAGELVLGTAGGTIDSNGFSVGTDNILSGSGSLTKAGAGTLTLTGLNSYTGGTVVSAGTLRITDAGTISSGGVNIASGASMFIDGPSSGSYTFSNALTGAGLLEVDLLNNSNIFDFSSGAGNAFSGTVLLGNSIFNLSGINTTALTDATLQLNNGNTTYVGSGTQNIAGLTLNGGALVFDNLTTGIVNTSGTLTLSAGSVAIDPNAITNNASANLLLQDDGIDFRLITAGNVVGSAGNLTLTDLVGNPVVDTADIIQNSNLVAIGSYDFALGNDATSLYTRYTLSQLDIQNGQVLSLFGDSITQTGADELRAKIIGSGNLSIDATNSITLNNSANSYTGSTTVTSGQLIVGSDNALGQTSNLIINSGTTTDLNGKTQTIGALNGGGNLNIHAGNLSIANGGLFSGILEGTSGQLTLQGGTLVLAGNNTYAGATSIDNGSVLQIGNGALTGSYVGDILNNGQVIFNRSDSSVYAGIISGDGSLTKNGLGSLTLNNENSYAGGTTIGAGTLIALQGKALGTGTINNNSILQLNFTGDSVLDNLLSGTGSLVKTGAGTATLTSNGSTQGSVSVNAGTLHFTQAGDFNAGSLNTASGATTSLAKDATLNISGALTQNLNSTLDITLGSANPVINSSSASLNGVLKVSGIDTSVIPTSASELNSSNVTIIRTTGGISGDFTDIDFDGATSSVDYLTLVGSKSSDDKDYNVGFGLTWFAGATKGNGLFTLANTDDLFIVDTILSDQGSSSTGWDGKSLTKAGAGTLILSSANTYSGSTSVNSGTLRTNVINAFASSGSVFVADGATLDFNSFSQQANNLSGAGLITLGNATLTANNSASTQFSGLISGDGSLTKLGIGMLTLSGENSYSNGTTITAGTLVAKQGKALGSGKIVNSSILQLDFDTDSTLSNLLSGSGTLTKNGNGTATLTSSGSSSGTISVNGGELTFAQNGAFNAIALVTASNASTTLLANSILNLSGMMLQNANSTLNIEIGGTQPVITTASAFLNGDLNITGFNTDIPNNASALADTEFTVIHTTGGITGNFLNIDLGGAASSVDYLTLAGRVVNNLDYNIGFGLTWLAGTTLGNGVFTLANQNDVFNLDVALTDQTASTTGWDGKTLTKAGLGTLVLSSINTYTGDTRINAGTLRTAIANAFANSANVSVANNATLDLNGFSQQANNLSGTGSIKLGNADLTVNNTTNTQFGGVIDGTGRLIKNGGNSLTLSNENTYSGGSIINVGSVIAKQGNVLGTGTITNNSNLQLDFAADSTLANQLLGNGSLVKSGSGTATLSNIGSTQGAISVNQGTLNFIQNGVFNGASLTTSTGATTSLAADSTLNLTGELRQNAGSVLNVAVGSAQPAISAQSATLSGNLNITGFSASAPNSASALTSTDFNVIHTTNGINGSFTNINLGGAASSVDYLTLAGRIVNGVDFNVGFGLTWLAGGTLGNGIFTLANQSDTFNLDMALTDQVASTTGWDGKTLTKAGLGTLLLSSVNTYTGDTRINAGTLRTAIANAFENSANVFVAGNATLDLNGFSQRANNLSGSGSIKLGNAGLTANNTTNTQFSGVIEGSGQLIKTGNSTLTLANENIYSGGSVLNAGTVVATQGKALGTGVVTNNATLQLDFANNGILANQLSGSGSLVKSGSGTATLTGIDSSQGVITVNSGVLNFAQSGVFNAISVTTASGASTSVAPDAALTLSSALTQNTNSILNVGVGTVQPVITADSATLAGTLNITGFSATAPTNAQALTNTEFLVIRTTNGINGDFTTVNLGGAASSVDYLTLGGKVVNGKDYQVGFGLTWQAGATTGNGNFTLANANDMFNMDIVLADQVISSTGWDGKTLTKAGQGTLLLSSANTYTGNTYINGGTLRTGINNAFAASANVSVAGGATLDLNNYSQWANNLSGAGSIKLGNATLTANTTTDSLFSGVISGSGQLTKEGNGTLTLSGENTYTGNSNINNGTVIVTQDKALGSGVVNNNATLQLNFAANGTLANQLNGNGELVKTGNNTVTLTGAGSSQGDIAVNGGNLTFAQSGTFNGDNLTTASGATTSLAANSTITLTDTLTQVAGSTLDVTLGTVEPLIDADKALIAGSLKVSGIDASVNPKKASELSNTQFTLIRTANGINGDFTSVDLDGVNSSVDYLTLNAGKSVDNKEYNVGFGLTWLAGATAGNGTFTLVDASDTFEVDEVLADQATSATGWNGKDLIKDGAGTLILSAANTYTGTTQIDKGTLQTNADNVFSQSANVVVNNGAVLKLNGFDQLANNLSGTGGIVLGNGNLTVNSLESTGFSGSISGNGGLIKEGSEIFTLSGVNFYDGTTTINQGRLVGTQGQALGLSDITNNAELELAFADNSTLSNQLSGNGTLIKTGSGTATLTNSGSSQGNVSVDEGKLKFNQSGAFNADDYLTEIGATTSMSADASLMIANEFKNEGTLEVVAGNTSPVVTADTANLGSSSIFNLSGYSAPETTSASQLAYNQFTIIQTSTAGNLSGDFSSINLGGATSPVDYLALTAINNGQNYDIGLALTWYAAYTATPEHAHGTFTLTGANEYFDLDVVLADESANAVTGWDGKTFTKEGAGTLQLSKANTYTGETRVNGGTLLAGNANIIANSERLIVADGATFNLDSFNQSVKNLAGAGNIVLGSATFTVDNEADNTFDGVISGSGGLTKTNTGLLVLSKNNQYSGTTNIASGSLQIGTGGTSGSVVGNIVNDGSLRFNRSDAYLYNATISGSGDLIQQGSGSLIFNKNQTYTGTTTVNSGALVLLDNSVLNSAENVTVAKGAMLGGYGGVNGSVINQGLLAVADAAMSQDNAPAGNFTIGGDLHNGGEVRMESINPSSQTIVKGNYIGNNGLLRLSTVLGDDKSTTDKLVVLGDTSGNTRVIVNNSGGKGAQTINGIEVINVSGQSNGQFTLANRVVAGAYEYSLYQGLPNSANGNWYLRSQGPEDKPQWRPEAGIYLGNQSMASRLQMQTLFDRRGSQFKSADSSAWGRMISGHVDSKAADGAIDMSSDYTLVQVGGDLFNFTDGNQGLVIGTMGSWGNAHTDSNGNRNLNGERYSATGSMNGYSLGVYATWYADVQEQKGAYVDNWYQYGWYKNHVKGEQMASDSYHSRPFAASLETGYSFILNDDVKNEWRLIPQAQVVYNQYSADRFVDSKDTVIDGQDNEMWNTRLGGRLSGKIQGKDFTLHPFTEVNWWYSKQDASVTFDGMRVSQDTPKNRAELKVGIQSEFDDSWSTWVHLEGQAGEDSYRSIGGGIGVRYAF